MWSATGTIAATIPSVSDIRRGGYDSEGWSGQGQVAERERRANLVQSGSFQSSVSNRSRRDSATQRPTRAERKSSATPQHDSVVEMAEEQHSIQMDVVQSTPSMLTGPHGFDEEHGLDDRHNYRHSNDNDTTAKRSTRPVEVLTAPYDNGYQFPPKHNWKESTAIGLKAFWKFFLTPLGFIVTVYGLNVVAWGGMLFLLLCNASKAMCTPTCNDINSPRRIWIEIDSQILNALFCVTGFGLIPWRFRDLWYLMKYRLFKDELAYRRLCGIHRSWFRMRGSERLPETLGPDNIVEYAHEYPSVTMPFPLSSIPDAPLTGLRAPPTKLWKMDFVVWAFVWNTFLQCVLSGFMWGLNRYDRPSWSTGLFVALACIVAAAAGFMQFKEGKACKGIEGVAVSEKDQIRLEHDREMGITHFNNINDEAPKKHKKNRDKGQSH